MYLKQKTCSRKIFIEKKNSRTLKNQGWKKDFFKNNSRPNKIQEPFIKKKYLQKWKSFFNFVFAKIIR